MKLDESSQILRTCWKHHCQITEKFEFLSMKSTVRQKYLMTGQLIHYTQGKLSFPEAMVTGICSDLKNTTDISLHRLFFKIIKMNKHARKLLYRHSKSLSSTGKKQYSHTPTASREIKQN